MARTRVPKLVGEDMELGNFIRGGTTRAGLGNSDAAARAVLREIGGTLAGSRATTPASVASHDAEARSASGWAYGGAWTNGSWSNYDPQDWGRRWLPGNGGGAYIDLGHFEATSPEVLSARDFVASHHAMLRIAQAAADAANAKLEPGECIELLAANSDRLGHSYGSHVNVMISRHCWDDLFHRGIHTLLSLAAHQVSSIIFTGQGKVGSENGRPPVDFQLAQRADFFEVVSGVQTTSHRPLVNSRDEALCGKNEGFARLHCIFYDNNLSHTALYLKVGTLQIVLAMIEAGWPLAHLILDDPVDSVVRWSHDPDLRTKCVLANTESVTAVDLQQRFVEAAQCANEAGLLDTVPDADDILDCWQRIVDRLRARAFDELLADLDWVKKRHAIERTLDRQTELGWDAPEVRYLDLAYASLDPARGLYWSYESAGVAARLVSEEDVSRFVDEPPEDTRAWTRAMLLRHLRPDQIAAVDWDHIDVVTRDDRGFTRTLSFDLADPLRMGRSEAAGLFEDTDALRRHIDELGCSDSHQRRRTSPDIHHH